MRKSILILTVPLLLFLALPASAQQRHIGFFGGVNLADIKFDPDIDTKMSAGPSIGVVGDLGLGTSNMLYLRIEPMWVMKGAKYDYATDPLPGDPTKEKWSYIEVPLLLRVAFGKSNVRPYVLAGPSVGFLLSAKEEVEGAADDLDVKDNIKSTSISGRAGAGVSIVAGKNHVFLEGQYELGLQDVLEDSQTLYPAGTEAKPNGFLVSAGVLFSFAGIY